MNCITDFVFDYHSKYGLIENANVISIENDDCAINILRKKVLLRTSLVNMKILSSPHEKIIDADKIDTNQNLILSFNDSCCMVKAIKIYDDKSVEVMPTSDLLLNNEPTKRVAVDNLSICGQYECFDALKSLSIPMPIEYCRYFNNISIFSPLLSHVNNALICWNAEELQLNIYSFDESSLKKIEFLIPIFISQLSLLLNGKLTKTIDKLSNFFVWEYQYENEEEANYAIGPKGSHILAVRNFRGIAGVVLTKSNRLRIIAENKFALKEARSMLEIKRESFLFDDSFIPILIGKNANHITELVTKSGLHCIHVPNSPWNGVLNEDIAVNSPSIQAKRELHLFGTRESINSAKLLLEMEESVKDLKKEFELRKNNKLRQSLSLKSSTSSISKDSDKAVNWERSQEEVFEDSTIKVDNPQPLSWADTQDDSGDDITKVTEVAPITSGKEGYTDFFSSQATNAARMRRQKKNQNWNQLHGCPNRAQSPEPPRNLQHNQQHQQQKRMTNWKTQKQYPSQGGGMLFTNSNLSSAVTMNDDKDESYQPHPGKVTSGQTRHRNNQYQNSSWNHNNNNSNNSNNNHNFRSHKNNSNRRPYQTYQDEDGYLVGGNSMYTHHQSTL